MVVPINIKSMKAAMEILCKCLSVKGNTYPPKAAYKLLSALKPHNCTVKHRINPDNLRVYGR
jgi:hypothetical protein